MHFFSKMISWFAKSPALEGPKKLAVQAITEAACNLVKTATTHAPDMAPQVEAAVSQAVSHAVAGVLTRGQG